MFLGIDQGTTGTTAVLISEKGQLMGSFTSAVPQHFPKPGWVEHDAEEIWSSVAKSVRQLLAKTKVKASKISSIGITNQRETVSVFSVRRKSEEALSRFIVWQDRRTSEICKALSENSARVEKMTGLPLDPYFSATKIYWLKKKLKLSERSPVVFRTIDSFLLNRMTGANAVEATNASRTSLMDLNKIDWSDELFNIFSIPKTWAPEIIDSEGWNYTTKNCGFLPDGIPVRACLGDQQAALFGQAGWTPGSGKITYGTGSFVLLNTGTTPVFSKNKMVATLALKLNGKSPFYALEGSAFICGAWIQWLRDNLKILKSSEDSEILAKKAKTSGGVIVIPALTGLAAPFWKPNARGAILGLTRGSGRAEISRASLEALAFQNKALINGMIRDIPDLKTKWRVDGGAVKNNLLLQIQADILNLPLIRPKNLEATATGIAFLSAYSAGALSLEDIQKIWKQDAVFRPSKKNSKYLEGNYKHWLEAAHQV